jgi:5-hydroxyisourate hydrolase
MSAITTHVLDTALGRPAAGLPVRLEHVGDAGCTEIASATTGSDGRIADLGPAQLEPGTYRLVFGTAAYAAVAHSTAAYTTGQQQPPFFPEVAVTFTVLDGTQHYHVPLLLSPFGYSTYRGS